MSAPLFLIKEFLHSDMDQKHMFKNTKKYYFYISCGLKTISNCCKFREISNSVS